MCIYCTLLLNSVKLTVAVADAEETLLSTVALTYSCIHMDKAKGIQYM